MGEIAEDYVSGACCSHCMSYFEEEHGYPVVCQSCWDDLVEEAVENPKDHDIIKEAGVITLIDGVQKAFLKEM